MIISAKDLEKEHEDSWDHNPVQQTILELLRGPLNNENYRKLSRDEIVKIVDEYLSVLNKTKHEKKVQRILRTIRKKTTVKDVILYLGEIILND